MNARNKTATAPLSLKAAFAAETERREAERRAKEEALRKQQEEDLAGAEQLLATLTRDGDFLQAHGLTADQRRYTVTLDHERFRISAYFESGAISITHSDKRASPSGASALRRQETVHGMADALRLIAQYLVDETA